MKEGWKAERGKEGGGVRKIASKYEGDGLIP